MALILPKSINGLPELETKLNAQDLKSWQGKKRTQRVNISLPKYKITWGSFSLNETLRYMGMPDAFDPSKANFSGMDGSRLLYIDSVIHKAFVDVNESGTEAAAATAVIMGVRSAAPAPDPIPVFKADHPFLFLIQDNRTGTILFMGRVVNPES